MGVNQYNLFVHIVIILTHYTPFAFLYPLKKLENLKVFMGYRKATSGCNGLNSLDHAKYFFAVVLLWQKLPLLSH